MLGCWLVPAVAEMKNPLLKRIPRELKHDFGKYFVMFAFMVLLISLISGFLVALGSCTVAYYSGMDTYQVEHGHLTFEKMPDRELLNELSEKANLDLFELYYLNLSTDTDKKIRVYKNRETVDIACIMEGTLPKAADEIAIDRLFAENNDYKVGGDIIIAGQKLNVVGTVALPDYSCLYENNSDMMFNASNFSVAVMTPGGFDRFKNYGVAYNYAWRHKENFDRFSKKESEDLSQKFLDVLEETLTARADRVIDETLPAGKLLLLDKVLNTIEVKLNAAGKSLAMYNNAAGKQALLRIIDDQLKEQNINLSEKLANNKRDVSLTTEDLSRALNRTTNDVAQAQRLVDSVDERVIKIKDYLPAHKNYAITFTIDDIGGDTAMFMAFSYIVIVVIAFVFAVTTSSTIYAEAGAIGTLRASGYTKRELLVHYMTLPVLVTLFAGIVGNILGYTVMKYHMASLYYHSYSLLKYETVWSSHAFVMTTVVPLILMFVINFAVLSQKLGLAPIKFLRRDLKRRKRKRAFYLSNSLPFMHRYRMRIVLQNLPNYLTLLLGIALGGATVIFSLMFTPLLKDYRDMLIDGRLSNYQYFLNDDTMAVDTLKPLPETAEEQQVSDTADEDHKRPKDNKPERFLLGMLKSHNEGFKEEDISVYGLNDDSAYVAIHLGKDDVVISASYADKYSIEVGDSIKLNDPYINKVYAFKVSGIYNYYGSLAAFTSKETFENSLDEQTHYARGIFSNRALDIDDTKLAKAVTPKDLTMIADQLEDSLGNFMGVLKSFGIIIFVLLMYLLSKQIIERSANSISMAKILGFRNKEISSIYILATSMVVVLGLIVACPAAYYILKLIFRTLIYQKMAGYFPFRISNSSYYSMFVIGMICYAVVSLFQMHKISRIPKAQVLKNIE